MGRLSSTATDLQSRLSLRLGGTHRVGVQIAGPPELEPPEILSWEHFIEACLLALVEVLPGDRHQVEFAATATEEVPGPVLVPAFAAPFAYLSSQWAVIVELEPCAEPAASPVNNRVVTLPIRVGSPAPGDGRRARLRDVVQRRLPLALELYRDANNRRTAEVVGRPARSAATRFNAGDEAQDGELPRRALLGMHWLEKGGAEEWAVRSAEIAAAAGMATTVMTSVPGHPDYLERLLAAGVQVRPLASILTATEAAAWIEAFVNDGVGLVHIHHCDWLYGAAPELRRRSPGTLVLDSTHILEHRTGGFVHTSVRYSPFIDEHHVISPQLRDFYRFDAGVPAEKIHFHPLVDEAPHARSHDGRGPGDPFTVGFLGRYVKQKRPFSFLEVARLVGRRDPSIRFVMQGDGYLRRGIEDYIDRHGLASVTLAPWDTNVDGFFEGIDLLLVSSENEGLTLTSLESIDRGVPVLSTDVGSQATAVGKDGLIDDHPIRFVRDASRRVRELAHDQTRWESLLSSQESNLADLRSLTSATDYLRSRVEGV